MYIGSVRFFKHIIISVLTFILLTIIILIITLFNSIVQAAYDGNGISADSQQVSAVDKDTSPNQLQNTNAENSISEIAVKKTTTASKPYQALYPDLYSEKPQKTVKQDNVVYLTFDDGPSERTAEILKILKENNIKATFFLIGKNDEKSKELMRQIVEDGHTVGVHSFTHKYKTIYNSVEAYLKDFNEMYNLIYEATGVKPSIFRFPGGSVNDFNKNIYKEIIQEMNRRGFTYFDWNVDSSDAVPSATVKRITQCVLNEVSSGSIVLFHDSSYKTETVSSLNGIIKNLKHSGYTFDKLTNAVKPITFKQN
ncbi:MAG: polysaccharide deacetylase [Clostridia bacterium]|nr:polysaccharide deacetylase [Clostridia bacterium]